MDSHLSVVRRRVRRRLRTVFVGVFWASIVYASMYVAGTWYGSGGTQDPGAAGGPFAWLWWLSLLVVAGGVTGYLVRSR